MKILAVSLGAVALVVPGASLAQVTQSYSYDANGRLTGVVTTGGAGTHTSTYAYDDASNRMSRSQTGTSAWAALLQLPVDQALQPDEALVSPDGRYSFAMRPSGRLELWFGDEPVPESVDNIRAGFHLGEDGRAWFIRPAEASSHPGMTLALADDGRLLLFDEIGSAARETSQAEGEGQ